MLSSSYLGCLGGTWAVLLFGYSLLCLCSRTRALPLGDPTDYQFNIRTSQGKYCRTSDGPSQFVYCDADAPDYLTTFNVQRSMGPVASPLLQGGSLRNQSFYLGFRPIGMFKYARFAISPSGYGVVLATSSAMLDPFLPPGTRPGPPGTVFPYQFSIEPDGSPDCETKEWGQPSSSCGLKLKILNVRWSLTDIRDAFCTIGNVEEQDLESVGKLSGLIICDPKLQPGDVSGIHLEVAGSQAFKSFNLKSVGSKGLCGFNMEGAVTCSDGIKACCALLGGRSSLPASTWWGYKLEAGSSAPLTTSTTFSLEAWDINLNIPLRKVYSNRSTSEVRVTSLPPSMTEDMMPEDANFRLVPNVKGKGGKAVGKKKEFYLYSVGAGKYCRSTSAGGKIICDKPMKVRKAKKRDDYLFKISIESCPMEGEGCV